MFQGETAITVDDKGRLAVPTAYRDQVAAVGNCLVLTYNPWEAGSLYLYVQAEWRRVRDELLARPNTQKVVRALQMKLVGAAMPLDLDAAGRISLPVSHRSNAGIEKKAVLLGMGEKFELWSEQAHRAQIQQTLSDEDLSEGLLGLRL